MSMKVSFTLRDSVFVYTETETKEKEQAGAVHQVALEELFTESTSPNLPKDELAVKDVDCYQVKERFIPYLIQCLLSGGAEILSALDPKRAKWYRSLANFALLPIRTIEKTREIGSVRFVNEESKKEDQSNCIYPVGDYNPLRIKISRRKLNRAAMPKKVRLRKAVKRIMHIGKRLKSMAL